MKHPNYYTDPNCDFTRTIAYSKIKNFIFEIDMYIKSRSREMFKRIKDDNILNKVREIIETTPLSDKKGRYANPAVVEVLEKITLLSDNSHFTNSFGNKIRMDFGTGHELNFLCYLYSQKDLDLSDLLSSLQEYFRIIRMFVKKFNIEPAGSRGCWSIDDYLLLPYLFGSSQNFNSKYKTNLILDGLFYEAQANNNSMKLKLMCNKSWVDINIELLTFYDQEVLNKSVVTQHFIFSGILPNRIIK